jgi:hypothetical protein
MEMNIPIKLATRKEYRGESIRFADRISPKKIRNTPVTHNRISEKISPPVEKKLKIPLFPGKKKSRYAFTDPINRFCGCLRN